MRPSPDARVHTDAASGLSYRSYGSRGPLVVTVHGGPAAAGSVGECARTLGNACRVLEPFQRTSSDIPLSVRRHVDDLHEFILSTCDRQRPVLLGHSWGAMLALCMASIHIDDCARLVLVGCGTFTEESRAVFARTVDERLDETTRTQLRALTGNGDDADMARAGRLLERAYSFDAEPDRDELISFDNRAHEQTWQDMLLQQHSGVYPGAFESIPIPVLMLHGAFDPHPGQMIRDTLSPLISGLEYRELPRCGHTPWRERQARAAFFEILHGWIANDSTTSS